MAFNAYKHNRYQGTSDENTARRVSSAKEELNFQLPGTPYSHIPHSATVHVPSSRIIHLSKPKIRKDFHIRKGKYS